MCVQCEDNKYFIFDRIRGFNGEKPIFCSWCGISLPEDDRLEVVVKHKYIPWPDYYCPKCDCEISNPYFKDGYMPMCCPECGQKVKKPSIHYPLGSK
jgi:hypothetical protein